MHSWWSIFYLVQYFSLPFFLFALFLFANDLFFTVWQAFCFDLDMSSSLFLSVGTSNRVKFPTIKSANHHYWYFFPFDTIYIDSNLHYQTCYHTCASLCKCYSMQDSKPVIFFIWLTQYKGLGYLITHSRWQFKLMLQYCLCCEMTHAESLSAFRLLFSLPTPILTSSKHLQGKKTICHCSFKSE